MATIWLYLGASFLALIGSIIVVAFLFFVVSWVRDKFIKRGIPKRGFFRNRNISEKKAVTQYIEAHKELFHVPPPLTQEDIKEVEDEQHRIDDKFREFERLRRIANPSTTITKGQRNSSSPPRNAEPQPGKLLPSRISELDTGTRDKARRASRSVKLDS